MLSCLLPGSRVLRCEQVKVGPGLVTIHVSSRKHWGSCPFCGRGSRRVHSRYTRTFADEPCHGQRVQLRWRSRRFFCDHPQCRRRIFTERLPEVASSYARRTHRLHKALRDIALTCGGRPGSRLAGRLSMPTSANCLLRIIRRLPEVEIVTPHVLGVDDWALRRGHRYGTILCDLEQHKPVDLLPERSSVGFRDWLKAHPGVKIISRDRGDEYAKGSRDGAPKAVQVADRWHLLHNLHEALMREADHRHRQIGQAVKAATKSSKASRSQEKSQLFSPAPSPPASSPSTKAEQQKQASRARRLVRYRKVMALHRRGLPLRAIGRHVKMSRRTVRRFIRADTFPERAERRSHSCLDPFAGYLKQRWGEGCHNATTLHKELRQRGFSGSHSTVRRRVAPWRKSAQRPCPPSPNPVAVPTKLKRPSPRHVAWLLTRDWCDLVEDERVLRRALRRHCPALRRAGALTRWFAHLVRKRQGDQLEAWIARASETGSPSEVCGFAQGLLRDLSSIQAALTLPWSNGQVEGQINRLKLIKRQMYGRANFDLLKARFLHAS